MKGFNLFLFIIVFIALILPFYGIYKYDLTCYFKKKYKGKQRRKPQIINLFS